jgi:hypothetical protein
VTSGSVMWHPHETNIVTMRSWEDRFGYGGILDERASDLAHETWRSWEKTDCQQAIYDLISGQYETEERSPKAWTPRGSEITVHEEDVDEICLQLTQDDTLLPAWDFIMMYLTDAWETAMRPHAGDMEDLVDEVREAVLEDYEIDEEVWGSLLEEGWQPNRLLAEVLDGFGYHGEENHPGYLTFDWKDTKPVKRRLAIGRTEEDLDHPGSLEIELRGIEVALLEEWDERIGKVEINADNRFEPRHAWRRATAEDGPAEAKKAILEFVRGLHRRGA